MLKLLYSQRIKADCTAYENSLKQQKKSSQQKLQTAERALREAALDQLKTANKYDLGQCTIELKKCMHLHNQSVLGIQKGFLDVGLFVRSML